MVRMFGVDRMRIAIVTEHHCADAFGGAEYRICLIAQSLAKLGHHVFYVCTSPHVTEWFSQDVHVIPLKVRTGSRRFGKNYFLYRSDLLRVLDRIRPEVIYQSVACAFTGIAASYAKKNGCRMVWHIASERDICPEPWVSFRTALFDYIDRRWTAHGIRSADAIIGQARYQDQLLYDRYGRRCDLIVGTPQPAPDGPIVKPGPVTVVWVANLKPLKQPEVFLRLVREFDDCQGIRFVMIGRPAYRSYQRRLEREMVGLKGFTYMGEQPLDRVNQVLAQSHILVNTSAYEGFPCTFIQAWLRCVPVVSLNVDPDDLLKTRQMGFHSRSFEGLVEDTGRLARDTALREAMGARALQYARRYHSMSVNMAQITALLTGIR
ncbi:MAG TPA: glycosyltransferase family 4 protein [Sedimentisphaerales bacterium]|nr:glycosyltransferase family 4 protein [Sedimentisphaerales bacterium]